MEYIPDSPGSSDGSPTTKQEFKTELRATEYAPVYVQLPSTPNEQPSGSRKGLRFRSLSLKPSARSKGGDGAPPPVPPKDKKEKKPKHREDLPMQLATDLALAQLLGGGTIEHHIQQAAQREAKRAGARKGPDGQYTGVADVYRDAEGRIWRDRDEAWEYHALIERNAPREEEQTWARRERRGRGVPGDVSPTSSLENYDAHAHHGKSKRRPEPLDLASSKSPASSRRQYADDARREFLESSFVPPVPPSEPKQRSGLLNMFKSSSSKKGHQ